MVDANGLDDASDQAVEEWQGHSTTPRCPRRSWSSWIGESLDPSRRRVGEVTHQSQLAITLMALLNAAVDYVVFSTVMLTGALKALVVELNASESKAYEPLGTVVVFQL